MAKLGGGDIESDTVVSPDSYDVALRAAGAVCDATRRLVHGEDTQALCLVRPPGHHALAHRAMGFCLFNNIALAAMTATEELGVNRVLILDWDVHHGNGTQATFWMSPQVGFVSIHRWPYFPGTGDENETGGGDGIGYTVNVPVPHNIRREDFLAGFSKAVERLTDRMKPELVLLSAGFDAHLGDPVGGLTLETEDFATLTEIALDAADAYAGGKLISVLEGGYSPRLLADSVEAHLRTMVERSRRPRS